MSVKDRITWIITITMCSFLLLSLVGAFVLEYAGRETGTVWGRIFDLINVLAGAIVGYVAGERVAQARAGEPPPTGFDYEIPHEGA